MSDDQANTSETSFRPISMRQVQGRWQITCSSRKPLYLSPSAGDETIATVRHAIDQMKKIEFRQVPGKDDEIASIETIVDPDLPEAVTSRAPKLKAEWTATVWTRRIPDNKKNYDTDNVLWSTHFPKNGFTRITFAKKTSPYYLADNHPDKKRILVLAEKSIAEGKPVKVAIFSEFLVDLQD